MTHTIRYVARTDRGLLRANNQDSVFAGDRLLVVADGMGGHVAGDTASRLAVAAFAPLDEVDPAGKDLLGPLENATHDGNNAIAEMVVQDPDLDGMGTTVTALLFDGKRLGIAHVGDSRAYLWRGGMLSQITHDDTFVQSLIDEGRITEEEASHHPQRSLLLRALNGGESEPTLYQRESQVGDRYLICSDGLSGVVSAEAIADTLASYETAEAADRLIELALRGGGPDNVTVIVADVIDTGENALADEAENTAVVDADATGPLGGMTFTRRMPRIALPKEPTVSELAAQAEATAPTQPVPTSDAGDYADPSGESGDDYEADDYDQDDDLVPDDGEDRARAKPMRIGPPSTPARRWGRTIAFVLAIVVLLGVGGVIAVQVIGSKYYVGENKDGRVAIFRGVDGSVLGFDLSSFQEDSCQGQQADCLPVSTGDLMQSARNQVLSGIPANDLTDARDILTRLRGELLPICVEETIPTSQSTPSSTSSSTTSSSSTSSSSSARNTRTGTDTTGTVQESGITGSSGLGLAPPNTDIQTTGSPDSSGTNASGTDASGSNAGSANSSSSRSSTSRTTSTSTTTTTTTASVSGTTVSSAPGVPGVTCRVAG